MVINFFVVYPIILFLILIACAFCGKSPKRDNYILLFALLLVFFFMAFRKDFTPDYRGYENMFNAVHRHEPREKLHIEIGYYLLNEILPSYRIVIVVASLLYCSGIYIFFRVFIPSRYWALAFILLFIDQFAFLICISAIRNSIALAALLWGVYSLSKGKKYLYIILVLLGSLFHASILIFIPLIFLSSSKPKLNWQVWSILFVFYVILSAIMPQIWGNLANLLLSQVNSLSGYSYYMDDLEGTSRGFSYLLLFFLLFFSLKTMSMQNLTPDEYLCLKLSLIWFLVVFSPVVGMISRYYVYVDFFIFAAVPVVIRHMYNRVLKYTYAFGVLLYLGLQLSVFLNGDSFNKFYLVYKTVLFE